MEIIEVEFKKMKSVEVKYVDKLNPTFVNEHTWRLLEDGSVELVDYQHYVAYEDEHPRKFVSNTSVEKAIDAINFYLSFSQWDRCVSFNINFNV